MSQSHSHSSKRPVHSTTGGDINVGKIIVIGAVSLSLFAVGVVWAYQIKTRSERVIQANGAARTPTEIGKPEIGIVDQVLFSVDHRIEVWRAEHAKRLSTYGWIDRSKGVARMPIELAMQQVVASPPDIAGEGVAPVARQPVAPASAVAPAKPAGKGKP
jgi:hypothetical protein